MSSAHSPDGQQHQSSQENTQGNHLEQNPPQGDHTASKIHSMPGSAENYFPHLADQDGSHCDIEGASPDYASTLSSPPSFLEPPPGFEDLGSLNDSPLQDKAIDTEVASPHAEPKTPRRRARLDPCASPGMVEALQIAHNLDITELGSPDARGTKTGRPLEATQSVGTATSVKQSGGSKSTARNPNGRRRGSTYDHGERSGNEGNLADIRASIVREPEIMKPPPVKKQKLGPASTRSSVDRVGYGAGPRMSGSIPPRIMPVKGNSRRKQNMKKRTWQWVLEVDSEELAKEEEAVEQKRAGSVPPSFRTNSFTFKHPSTPSQPSSTNDGNELLEGLHPAAAGNRAIRAYSEGATAPDTPPVVPLREKRHGILASLPTTLGRLRPRKSPVTQEAPKLPTIHCPAKLGSNAVINGAVNDDVDQEAEGEIVSGGNTDDKYVHNEQINSSEKACMSSASMDNEAATKDKQDRDTHVLDTIHVSVGVTRGGSTASITKKRKLSSDSVNTEGRHNNNAEGATPESISEMLHLKPSSAPKLATNGEEIDPRYFEGALRLVNDKWMVPQSCNACKQGNRFCDRDYPCGNCVKNKKRCVRPDGLVLARNRGYKQTKTTAAATSENVAKKPRGSYTTSRLKKEIPGQESVIEENQARKPPCIGRPPVWCDSRQELCETLPYYRSYQSGCYYHHGLIFGYLMDGFGSARDYIDGKVIVAHSGGKSGIDDDGIRKLLDDQSPEDASIKCLLANIRDRWPVAMIMGNQCNSSPSKIPHRYCVMDWFKVTAAWGERDTLSKHVRYKFRYEKLDSSTDGWWAAHPSQEPDKPVELVWHTCEQCRQQSIHIYEQGWMCLRPECTSFWKLDDEDPPETLTYTETFLNARTPWPEEFCIPPTPLAPPVTTHGTMYDGGDVTRMFWRGMCCPKCGRCNCREFWDSWRCLACDFRINPPRTIFEPYRLLDAHRPVYTGPAMPSNLVSDDILSTKLVCDGLTVLHYTLGNCGTVTHILANRESNARPYDADWLFTNYQDPQLPFRRFPMKNHQTTGRLLTQHFTFNCGAPYKFVVDVDSMPFEDAPPVVNKALELIHERVKLVYPSAEFNEILNVGYFEAQKMGYHDDGEAGLGDTVASISLGAPARMRFRLKSRHVNDTQRWKSRDSNGHSMEIDDDDDDDEDEGANEHGRRGIKNGKCRVKLDLLLSHGDVMIMRGRDIQKFWEHTAIPSGLFRIAVTARQITAEHPSVVPGQSMQGKRLQPKSDAVSSAPVTGPTVTLANSRVDQEIEQIPHQAPPEGTTNDDIRTTDNEVGVSGATGTQQSMLPSIRGVLEELSLPGLNASTYHPQAMALQQNQGFSASNGNHHNSPPSGIEMLPRSSMNTQYPLSLRPPYQAEQPPSLPAPTYEYPDATNEHHPSVSVPQAGFGDSQSVNGNTTINEAPGAEDRNGNILPPLAVENDDRIHTDGQSRNSI